MVLEQVLARGPLSPEAKRVVLAAVPPMGSDYDRRQVLTAYVDKYGVDADGA